MSLHAPSSHTLGSWWGYAEGDPTLVGLLVVFVAGSAIAYLILRARSNRDARNDQPKRGKRGKRGKR